jgi:hypothetical protein
MSLIDFTDKTNQCRAYKNKLKNQQCSSRIKNSIFCGKHKNNLEPIYDENGKIINEIMKDENNTILDKNNTNDINTLSKIASIQPVSSNIYRKLVGSELYNNYLNSRKTYVKESNKHIELVEYIENSKLELYPYSRILASLEYYKLINRPINRPINQVANSATNEKITLISPNISLLESFFHILLKANTNIDKLVKLQRWIRSSLQSFNYRLHGFAWYNRSLCVNDSDFVTLDDIREIPQDDFISFKDNAGFVYGFSLDSLTDLILKTDDNFYENFKKSSSSIGMCYRQYIRALHNHYNKIKVNNPYTRDLLPGEFKLKIIRLYTRKIFGKYMRLGNICVSSIIAGSSASDIKVQVRNKCLSVFQKIDMFGYMTNTSWLMDENVKRLKIFYGKLAIQWNLDFGLNNTARYKISRTHNLFSNLQDIILSRADKYVLLDKILDTLNILVSNGESDADRNTGCILILYALASINPGCIEANPWLA